MVLKRPTTKSGGMWIFPMSLAVSNFKGWISGTHSNGIKLVRLYVMNQ
jgi:hypothetical protein